MLRWSWLPLAVLSCTPDASTKAKGPAGSAAPSASGAASGAPAPSATSPTVVRGTIEAIRLEDINKAEGHHTYNVELLVRHAAIEGASPFARDVPPVVTVRVDKVFFDELPAAKRAEIAPEGPRPQLSPKRYGRYEVGADVTLPVTFTSPGLASLRAP